MIARNVGPFLQLQQVTFHETARNLCPSFPHGNVFLFFTHESSIEFDHAVYINFHHSFYRLLYLCFISYKTQNIISLYGALQK
jgi:hypothetical protein